MLALTRLGTVLRPTHKIFLLRNFHSPDLLYKNGFESCLQRTRQEAHHQRTFKISRRGPRMPLKILQHRPNPTMGPRRLTEWGFYPQKKRWVPQVPRYGVVRPHWGRPQKRKTDTMLPRDGGLCLHRPAGLCRGHGLSDRRRYVRFFLCTCVCMDV